MKKTLVLLTILMLILQSCEKENKVEKEIAAIPMDLSIDRFEQQYYKGTPEGLPSLKKKYPYFFPAQYPDSTWTLRMRDSLQLEIVGEIDRVFPDLDEEEQEIELLFKHVKYYFPQLTIPRPITVVSDVDEKNKVILADSLLIIGIDTYLGQDSKLYQGITTYKAANMNRSQIVPDIAEEVAIQVTPRPRARTLLAQMVYEGKLLYIKDLLIPSASDARKIGYSEGHQTWCQENEVYMWRYFVERELLFKTDPKLVHRFINDAPFSKFYLEIDNESPGRVGRWLGWQIVRAYMKNNDVSLQALLGTPAEDIFNNSRYKPKK